MVMSVILGMGVPGVAAYVIVQAVAVPVLIKAGAAPLPAHLFCLIYACLSNITPPVAISAYVASGIAGSGQMKTALRSVRLGLTGFIIPFFFLDNSVLLIGADKEAALSVTIRAVLTALAGTMALVAGMEGRLFCRAALWERAVLIFTSPLLLFPGMRSDVLGLFGITIVMIFQYARWKKEKRDTGH